MEKSTTPWLAQKATEYIYRGCVDLSDPEIRRHTALHNITAVLGLLVAAAFGVGNLVQGNNTLGSILVATALVMLLAILIHHRTNSPILGAWIGVSAAGGLFLYMLASRGSGSTGFVWLPVFPLFPMFTLGRTRGMVLSLAYLAVAAIFLFVPDLPGGIAGYPLPLAVRLWVASAFTAVLAFYYEYSREQAHARIRAEVEVRRQAEAEVTRALQAKSALLAAVSHEVRTPLTAIMGLHELLLHTDLDDKQRSYLELAKRSGRSLIAVMNDILDLSRVEAGKLHFERVPFDLHEVARALVDVQQVLAADRHLTLALDWDKEMPGAMVGDPARVRQVLSNLISNAAKFTPSGSVIVRVRRVEPDVLMVSVDDTGIGLSEEQQATTFDAFIQADATAGGSGLGLAIAKNLVEAMGGEIGVLSEEGKGSSFWFRLPLEVAEEDEVEVAAGEETSFTARILLVEDNDLNRDVLRLMLERMGCTVDTATNGAEGVAAFGAASYDLVLMDCQMPVLDGYAATSRIRAAEADNGHTPIVAITAYALPEDLQRCIEAGMDDHITKPLLLEDVVAVLGHWLASTGTDTSLPANELQSPRTG